VIGRAFEKIEEVEQVPDLEEERRKGNGYDASPLTTTAPLSAEPKLLTTG
jgi:hypothetical protein